MVNSGFTPYPDQQILTSVIVHSIKQAAPFYRLHKQIQLNLRPCLPIPRLAEDDDTVTRKALQNKMVQFAKSCVHSPIIQFQRTNHELAECTLNLKTNLHKNKDESLKGDDDDDSNNNIENRVVEVVVDDNRILHSDDVKFPVFILSSSSASMSVEKSGKEKKQKTFVKKLQQYGLFSKIYYQVFENENSFLFKKGTELLDLSKSKGDQSQKQHESIRFEKELMKRIIMHANKTKMERFAVIRDDVLFHNNFEKEFETLLADRRCNFPFINENGGVFMFGSKQTHEDWKLIQQ
eukprot:Awhi_evm1s411